MTLKLAYIEIYERYYLRTCLYCLASFVLKAIKAGVNMNKDTFFIQA